MKDKIVTFSKYGDAGTFPMPKGKDAFYAADEAGYPNQFIHSGAGHDAQFASYMLPTTMIFVQSKDGLSHCERNIHLPSIAQKELLLCSTLY